MRRPSLLHVRRTGLGVAILSLPLAVGVEVPQDSSLTQIRVAGGGGQYVAVMRDCEGNVLSKEEDSFYDAAVQIEHKFADPFSIGLAGGWLHDGRYASGDGYYYLNLAMGLSWRRFGMSAGATRFSNELLDPDDATASTGGGVSYLPSFAMRIGSTAGPYFSFAILSSFPMYSDGGYVETGLGVSPSPLTSLWAGVSMAGMTATGLALRTEFRLSDRFFLDTGVSVGSREGDLQGGGNIGITYRVIH